MNEKKGARDSHDFESYFKRAASPMLVLRLLSEGSMYVYQLSQELKRRSGGKYDMSLVYPVIYRLEKLGFVEGAGKEISADNRVRNYYSITEDGKKHLAQLSKEYEEMVQAVREIMAHAGGGPETAGGGPGGQPMGFKGGWQ